MGRFGRKVRDLGVVILSLVVWYAILLPVLLPAADSLVNVLEAHNLTKVTIPQKVYERVNDTFQWVDKPVQINLTGLIHFIIVFMLAVAPIAIAALWLRW